MRSRVRIGLVALWGTLALVASARGDWPAKVFSPYVQMDSGDGIQITEVHAATGQKFYTLAFVVADRDDVPTWGGTGKTVASNYYAKQIDAIRAAGGDVIVSFGGEGSGKIGSRELALTTNDLATLRARYESVVTQYHATWLDLDVEGEDVLPKHEANHLRNAALKSLQDAHPGLLIAYTLPADPDGLSDSSIDLLKDAKEKGLKVRDVDAMTMDFGPRFSRGKKTCDVCIATAKAVHQQVEKIDPTIAVGMTVMIGQNDEKSEVFSLDDAKAVLEFAQRTPWINHIGMWSANRDNGGGKSNWPSDTHSGVPQKPWDFINTFKSYSGRGQAAPSTNK